MLLFLRGQKVSFNNFAQEIALKTIVICSKTALIVMFLLLSITRQLHLVFIEQTFRSYKRLLLHCAPPPTDRIDGISPLVADPPQ